MAGEIQVNSVTALTESGSNIVLNNVDTATNRTNLGLGSMATQAANSVSISGGNITGGTIGSSVVFPSNHVIQVVSENFTGTSSAGNTTYVDTVITKSITSLAANSKFLVMVTSMTGGVDATSRVQLRRTVGATTYDIENATGQDGVTMGSDARLTSVQTGINFHLSYVDSPAASASTSINYKIRLRSADTNTVYLGQSGYSGAGDGDYKVLSSITIMELAA